jgi:hypothetical protein
LNLGNMSLTVWGMLTIAGASAPRIERGTGAAGRSGCTSVLQPTSGLWLEYCNKCHLSFSPSSGGSQALSHTCRHAGTGSCRHHTAGRRPTWLSICGRRPVVTLTQKGEMSQASFCILLSIVAGGKQEVQPGVRLAGLSHAPLVVVPKCRGCALIRSSTCRVQQPYAFSLPVAPL